MRKIFSQHNSRSSLQQDLTTNEQPSQAQSPIEPSTPAPMSNLSQGKRNSSIINEAEDSNPILSTRFHSSSGQIDLASQGFFHSNPQQIKQFFDPLRLNLRFLPSSLSLKTQFNLGCKYYEMKDYTNALVAFKRGLGNPSEQFYCKFHIGITLFKLGLFQEALLEYEALEKEHQKNQFVLYNKAVCYL